MAETVIISPSVERVKGTFVIGVFDNYSYTLMTIGFVILLAIIWTSIQLENYQKLTFKSPTLFEENML